VTRLVLTVSSSPRPLAELAPDARRRIRFLLTDIDDTLTADGRLGADAYAAVERLAAAGIAVIPVTGRPAGWCDMIARFWPVAAVVGENGALYYRYDHAGRRMLRRYWDEPAVRAEKRRRLDRLAPEILAAVPGAAIAADQPFRIADLAIDFCEDVAPLPPEAVDRIVAAFAAAGAVAKVSSIHVNGWFGTYDKLAMTRALFDEVFGIDLERRQDEVAFIGDSPNDEPMFAFFRNAVAVADIARFLPRLGARPAWVTAGGSGLGFVELAEALLAVREAASPPAAMAASR
jgi:HAD superfamily hydrolase (TIGR01484 family)